MLLLSAGHDEDGICGSPSTIYQTEMLKGRVGVNREGQQGENIQGIRTEHLELKKGFTEGYGHHIPSHMHTRILPNLTPFTDTSCTQIQDVHLLYTYTQTGSLPG